MPEKSLLRNLRGDLKLPITKISAFRKIRDLAIILCFNSIIGHQPSAIFLMRLINKDLVQSVSRR